MSPTRSERGAPAGLADALLEYARAAKALLVRMWNATVVFLGLGPGAQGFVDAVRNDVVVGWAHIPGRPEARVEVCVYQGDRVVGSSLADLPRKDLVAARVGDGRYGFQVRLLMHQLSGPEDMLQVFALTDSGRVALTGGTIALPDGAKATRGRPSGAGLLERVQGPYLQGWACNPDQPNSPALVDVYDDERYLGSATADRDRPRSAEQGLPSQARGFVLDLGFVPDAATCERLRARISGTAFELQRSPRYPGSRDPADLGEPIRASRRAAVSRREPVVEDEAADETDDVPRPITDAGTTTPPDLVAGLVLLARGAAVKDIAASVSSWSAQSAPLTRTAVVGIGAREGAGDELTEDLVQAITWIEAESGEELRTFLSEIEFAVFARAGDVFDPDLASVITRLGGFPDVVVWDCSSDGCFVRSGEAARLESFLSVSDAAGFAARASSVLRSPGKLETELREGSLHALRIWLAAQPDLRWCAVEALARIEGEERPKRTTLPSSEIYSGLVDGGGWIHRAHAEGDAPVLEPAARPRRISIAIWRGWDKEEIPALKSLLAEPFDGAVQILVPTSGSSERGEARLAALQTATPESRSISRKIVATMDTAADVCAAMLAAADGDVVILIDGAVSLPKGSLDEILAWASHEKSGVVTTALKNGTNVPVASAMNIAGDRATIVGCAGASEARVVDGVLPAIMVVANHKAVAAGGIDAMRFPDAFWGLEFCLRLRQSGYQSIRLGHIEASTLSVPRPLPERLPLKTRILLRSANLLEA